MLIIESKLRLKNANGGKKQLNEGKAIWGKMGNVNMERGEYSPPDMVLKLKNYYGVYSGLSIYESG